MWCNGDVPCINSISTVLPGFLNIVVYVSGIWRRNKKDHFYPFILCYTLSMTNNNEVLDLGCLDIEIYKCITELIATDRVIISGKQLLHMADHHPESYTETLIELKSTIQSPDYIFRDDKHAHTGLVAKRLQDNSESLYIVLRVCTDSQGGSLANSVISGWKICEKRLEN